MFGKDHPETISTRHNLGEMYMMWNKPDQAKELFDENIELMNAKNQKEKESVSAAMKDEPNKFWS